MPDAAAQGSTAAGFRYTADQLACVSLHETSHGRLDTQTGAHLRHETLGRDGVLQLRARPAGSTIAIEAWYDSLALSRVIQQLLYDVQPHDPLTFVAVSLGLLAVVVIACAIPARRASGVAPAEALRGE